MVDREHIDHDFVYAYQLKACVRNDTGGYNIPNKYVRRDGNLFNLKGSTESVPQQPSTEDDIKFELALENAKEHTIPGSYDSIEEFSDPEEKFRGIILKTREPSPVSLYLAAVLGVVMYAWLVTHLFTSGTY